MILLETATALPLLPTPWTVVIDTREQRGFSMAHAMDESDWDETSCPNCGGVFCKSCGRLLHDDRCGRPADPWTFAQPLQGLRKRLYAVQTTVGTLATGDYSLVGYERKTAIERKSLSDLYSTLGQGRSRFVRELERMNEMEFAAVVIEADWNTIISAPPHHSKLLPKTVFASVVSWQQRFTRVHWWPCNGRAVAEAVTVRILERFWRDHNPPGSKRPPEDIQPGQPK